MREGALTQGGRRKQDEAEKRLAFGGMDIV
jgi:hypothetical protein